MRFSTAFAFAASATTFALFAASPAQAADDRILVKYNGNEIKDFCNKWRCNCVNYVPKDTSLTFQSTYCQLGDFQGRDPNSEARVFCNFTNGKSTTAVNKHVAAATGATLN